MAADPAMTPDEFVSTVLDPGISWCEAVPGWGIPFDQRARVLLLAIAGQESNWTDRLQSGNGPAHSFWQMERKGGVAGVLNDDALSYLPDDVCGNAGISPNSVAVWGVFATAKGDNLAVAFSRLLLWSDTAPLPAIGDEEGAWEYYLRNWRPGKPSRERWSVVYPQAEAALKGPNS